MSDPVRSIHLPSATAQEALRQRAQVAFDEWARSWARNCADGAPHVQIETLTTAMNSRQHEYEVMQAGPGRIWFRTGKFDRAAFARAVVGPALMLDASPVDEWVQMAVNRAREARNLSLCVALFGGTLFDSRAHSTTLPSSLFAFGSGAMVVRCEPLGCFAIVDGAVWRSVPPSERGSAQRRSELTPIERAVDGGRVRLEIELGNIELAVPRLLDLQPGDVLRVPERLDQGITVCSGGKPLARAVLGQRGGRKCVQIVSSCS
jgi:flagellar motor switch/type III secretory pathway protein FliN